MKTLLILGPKGGSGKTTVARNIASAAAQAGIATATLDTDPQGTLTAWWQRRPGEAPNIDHYSESLSKITAPPEPLDLIELLVIDTPTAIESYPTGTASLFKAADLVLVPVRPTPEDLDSISGMRQYLREQGRPTAYVLNATKPRIRDVVDARRMLSGFGEVVPVDLPDRTDVYRSFSRGVGVVEVEGAKTRPDFEALWNYVGSRLGLVTP
ncbi:nucleotide-binding protein [Azospirillum sp. sgz302134]